MRLADAIAAMDPARLESFVARHGIAVDPRKQLAAAEQIARALTQPGRRGRAALAGRSAVASLAGFERWPDEVRSVARLLAASRHGRRRDELGGGVIPLIDADLALPAPGAPERVVMPGAYRVLVPASPADDPRALRLLLGGADDETLLAMQAHLFGRASTAPRALVLGDLLERLEDAGAIEEEIGKLPAREHALLAAIEARGSELDVGEVLELEKEPVRYASATPATLPKRSAAYGLMRRGLLFAVPPDRLVVPTEVAERIGAERRAAAAQVRAQTKRRVASIDLTPARARLAEDPGPAAVGLLAALRAEGVAIPADGGAPRTAVKRAARWVGIAGEEGAAQMLIAVARASGLARSSAPIATAGGALFERWRRSGAWDEAREDPDGHRASPGASSRRGRGGPSVRQPTPTAALRAAVLDVLEELPPGRFALVDDVIASALSDLRASSAERLLQRANARARGGFVATPRAAVERILRVSLPLLGAVDVGRAEHENDRAGEAHAREVVRLSARARRWLADPAPGSGAPEGTPAESRWEGGRFRIDPTTPIVRVLAAADAIDVVLSGGDLVGLVTEATLRRAIERGADLDEIAARLESIAGPFADDQPAQRAFESVRAGRILCTLVPASAFVAIADPALLAQLAADADAAELFVFPSPAGGLLVRDGVPLARVSRFLRRYGGEIAISDSPSKIRS